MNIQVDWLDSENGILATTTFEPDTVEWSEFEQKPLYEIIRMAGDECTYITMELI